MQCFIQTLKSCAVAMIVDEFCQQFLNVFCLTNFRFVQLNARDTIAIKERYKSHPSLDTVLLFNEDPERPVASISMADIPTQTLSNIVATNQYLALPRLSSQDLLEGIHLI